MFIVDMADTPGQMALPGAAKEAEIVAQHCGDKWVRRSGSNATCEQILTQLAQCEGAHFACHGYTDLEDPSNSHLVLYDRPLLASEVSHLRLEHAELAFLSACDSAAANIALKNETVHIAGAFHLAGFRHVIGTLWPIHDAVACEIAELFYSVIVPEWPRSGRSSPPPSAALHEALQRVRTGYKMEPWLWAAHIHVGP